MQIINNNLLAAVRQRSCCWCGKPGPSEAAHVYAKGFGGAFRLDHRFNLCPLCREDHQAHHDGHRPLKADLLALIAAREGVLQSDLEAELLRLRRIEGKPKRWKHRLRRKK